MITPQKQTNSKTILLPSVNKKSKLKVKAKVPSENGKMTSFSIIQIPIFPKKQSPLPKAIPVVQIVNLVSKNPLLNRILMKRNRFQ